MRLYRRNFLRLYRRNILRIYTPPSMATAGYSGTPLLQKLGIKPSTKLLLIDAPGKYEDLVQANISNLFVKKTQTPDLVHLFVKDNKQFESGMKKLKPFIKKNTSIIIWVSWYKKSAKIPTDMTEDIIRNYALANGLVDVKVCAVSDIWSGLKLVVPLKLRN